MVILFQEGIPDIFFPALDMRGVRIVRFSQNSVVAREIFRRHAGTEAVFFRANFSFGAAELDLLPRLRVAALVSTGAENIDAAVFAARQVKLVTGAGANAQAVFDYVVQALLLGGFQAERHSVGVIGVGRIGSRVLNFLGDTGVRTAHFDPFIANKGSYADAVACDYVTLHVPLTYAGNYKTSEMLREEYFAPATGKVRIIQSCRGGIWDRQFYGSLGEHHRIEILAQDVYPTEPPAVNALRYAKFSTPHIAGYSTRGRLGGILNGIRAIFPDFSWEDQFPKGRAWFLREESAAFAANPASFTSLRDNYFWRKEFHEYDNAEKSAFCRQFPHIASGFFERLFAFKPS